MWKTGVDKSHYWQCENCQKQNNHDRTNCWNCSTPKGEFKGDIPDVALATGSGVGERPIACVKCSAKLDEDSRFCPKCAAPVLLYSTKDCPNCRKTVDASASFCKFCATDLTQKNDFQYQRESSSRSSDVSLDSRRENADKMALGGGVLAVVSGLAFFWGTSYTGDLANKARAGIGGLMGQTDSTFVLAQWCIGLGAIGAIVGVTIFIIGMSQRSR